MGRQINFFTTSEDEKAFLDYARSTCDLAILPCRNKTPEFPTLEHLPTRESDDFWLHLYLLNRDVSHKVVTEFVPQQDHYYIDHFTSDVVEFSRSALVDDRYPRGRIYVEFYSHFDKNSGEWIGKSQELVKWFERLVRWIRKNFRKEDWLIYTGPGAQRLLNSGDFVISSGWLSMKRVQKENR